MIARKLREDSRRIHWLAIHDGPITPQDAKAAQAAAGFMPAGYGFDGFQVDDKSDPGGEYQVAEWYCSASCD